MNFIARRAASAFTIQLVAKRHHSTNIVANTISNDKNRLRLDEEKYCNDISSPLKEPFGGVLEALAKKTEAEFRNPHMMVSSLQGKLLHQLVSIFRPQHVLEIGGFTGYSAIAMGSALSPKATLLSLELDPKCIEFAQTFVNEAQLQDKVKFRQGPAIDSLAYLGQTITSNANKTKLDADKGGYIQYFDSILKHDLLSEKGILLVDNVLFFGHVYKQAGQISNQVEIDEEKHESASENINKTALKVHKFNQHVANDHRVESVSLPLFDGLTIIRKK
ncbi:hypothetical protein [Parasitella parasitica]|uniref:O-methyltransferase domain-containing protein n=1 Tax=Parasitella parasitica TaxID=35722 RepID=A0A0B7N4F4_9FUNG|nr:hypothetical protein [Parasitella parasitica]